jgi:hypothetical protein
MKSGVLAAWRPERRTLGPAHGMFHVEHPGAGPAGGIEFQPTGCGGPRSALRSRSGGAAATPETLKKTLPEPRPCAQKRPRILGNRRNPPVQGLLCELPAARRTAETPVHFVRADFPASWGAPRDFAWISRETAGDSRPLENHVASSRMRPNPRIPPPNSRISPVPWRDSWLLTLNPERGTRNLELGNWTSPRTCPAPRALK